MKPEDILDAIGNVDDDCIKEAKERQKRGKTLKIVFRSLAACLALVIGLPMLYMITFGANGAAPEHAGMDNQTGPDYVIARIEVVSTEKKVKYAARENTEPIAEFIRDISVKETGMNVNVDFDAKLQPGEIQILIREHTGEEKEYRLYGTYFYDIDGGQRYELTEQRAEKLRELLGISE